VFVDGEPVELTATEFRLLLYLVSQPCNVFSRQQILQGLNDGIFAVTDRAVDVQISGLRKKLGSAAKYLETVRGCGYRWRDPVDVAIENEDGDLGSRQSRAI
jgi:two-component system phosphate regulon response regulator PhoB